MRVIHFLDNLDPSGGGPALMLVKLATFQAAAGLDCRVISLEHPRQTQAIDRFIADQGDAQRVHWQRLQITSRLQRARPARLVASSLKDLSREDTVHLHGLWSPLGLAGARLARRVGAPYIVRPAGMLEPWSLNQKKWKKRLAMRLAFADLLRNAAALHATARSEAQQFRRLHFTNPTAVIPNGIDLQAYEAPLQRDLIDDNWPSLRGKHILLFLSRLHPKKGLEMLAAIWNKIACDFPQWHLVIAGPDDPPHQSQITQILQSANNLHRTTFCGPVLGDLKTQLLLASSLFILPTHSENFGIVVVEALAAGSPVITTHGTPWRELSDQGCGWCVPVNPTDIEAALRQALGLSHLQLADMGRRGREYVQTQFAIQAVTDKTTQLYRWLHQQADRPSFLLD